MSEKHVFLSYCCENADEVAQLYDDLVAEGERVWMDKKNLLAGQDFEFEIRQALKNDSYAVVVCFSKELEARSQSGVYPEVADAIEEYRKQGPGNIFLIPVRLSDCSIPSIKIDATRTLSSLHREDLFPSDKRAEGLSRLIQALNVAKFKNTGSLIPTLYPPPIRSPVKVPAPGRNYISLSQAERDQLESNMRKLLDFDDLVYIWYKLFDEYPRDSIGDVNKEKIIIELSRRLNQKKLGYNELLKFILEKNNNFEIN